MSLFNQTQRQLLQELRKHPRLQERVERLESIDGVGTIMALTWVLEVAIRSGWGRSPKPAVIVV